MSLSLKMFAFTVKFDAKTKRAKFIFSPEIIMKYKPIKDS